MAKAEKKQASRIKIKKKTWHKIIAPAIFGNKEIGESYLAAPESSLNRVLKVSLKELTGNMKDQSAYVGFRISAVEGATLRAEVIGYELVPTYVKRLVRKNTDRADDYFMLSTKDGQQVILKTLIITTNKTQRAVKAAMRVIMAETLRAELGKNTFSGFMSELVSGKIRSVLKKKVSKIYPVREAAIRMLTLPGTAVSAEKPAKELVSEQATLQEKPVEEAAEA